MTDFVRQRFLSMQLLAKLVATVYFLTLLWLVLFKFSFDLASVLQYQTRILNLIPFAGNNPREIIDNFNVFVPFGLLLSTVLKQSTLRQKLAFVVTFSLVAEILQYILAIGRTDITDLLANTFGGFVGLTLYDLFGKRISEEKLDRCVVAAGAILLIAIIVLRVFVLKVRY